MIRLSEQQKKQRKKQLNQANEEELKNIKQLEKQLGLKKRKSKNLPKSFLDDGLDYILDACDSAKLGQMNDLSEDEDAEKSVEMNLEDKYSSSSDEDDLIEGVDYDFESDEKEDGMEVDESQDNPDLSEDESNTEEDHVSGDELEDADDEDEVELNSPGKDCSEYIWEDIYGRKRDTDGNIIKETTIGNESDTDLSKNPEPETKSKYIPPALRNKPATENEASKAALLRLKKQLKGMLNRLAETNMVSIAKQVEGLYREHSRNDLNMTLTDLLLFSLVGLTVTPIRLVMEHVLLLAILHANVGTEVGAQ